MATARSTAPSHGWRRTHPAQLLELLVHPQRALPRLQSFESTAGLIGFPAVSGVFVAYTLAKGLALGDRIGFAATALMVVAGGALLGVIALWFAGSLPHWSAQLDDAEQEETNTLFVLFSEATWPFLPLLLIVAPLDLYYQGTSVFSATHDPTPSTVAWLERILVLMAIALWLIMMVRGTAVARHETEARAARELVRWGAELIAIAVLFTLILAVSLMYW
jgi:hypothetical protein